MINEELLKEGVKNCVCTVTQFYFENVIQMIFGTPSIEYYNYNIPFFPLYILVSNLTARLACANMQIK